MALNRRIVFLLLALTAAALVFVSLQANQSAHAQGEADNLRALLDSLNSSGASITIQFDRPVAAGETLMTLPDATLKRTISEVGADYLCFAEPWNDGTRSYCTPFSNVVSVSFIR